MSTMAAAIARSNSVRAAAYEHGMRLKEAGVIDLSPGMISPFGGLRDQTGHRERLSLFRGWLYAAINALASEAAGQPVVVAKLKGGGKKPKPSKALDGLRAKMPAAARTKAAKQEFEVLMEHPLLELLEWPNPIQSRWQFVYSFVASINLTGWGYIVGGENEDGKWEFYSIPTTWVIPDHKEGPFSRFKITDPSKPTTSQAEDEWLTRENVAFAYLPNPADPRMALAPAASQMPAVRIDDHIQASQEQFFDNGIFPGAIVTIGKDPHPDVPGGVRPRLSAAQRRQVMGAIRKVMAGVANYGNPAIIDGLIESIERLSMTSNEMGWEKSEQAVRTRLLSAFSVHPYILGEPVAVGGYAQVVNIEKRFYKRVNTFLDMLSSIVTEFVLRVVEGGSENLLAWWEECQSVDPSLRWSNLNAARGRGDVSRNEIRVELGLPPDESGGDATKNFTAGDINAIVAVQGAVAEGKITPQQAQVIYETAFDMDPADAKKLAGKAPPKPEAPPAGGPGPVGAGGAGPEEPAEPPTEEEAVEQAAKELEKAVAALGLSVAWGGLPEATADAVITATKFNPNHGPDGRFSSGGGMLAPDTGGGFGGGGSDAQWERRRDREEGTQAEADREVRKAQKAVDKARTELEVAKVTLAAADEAKQAGLKSIEDYFSQKQSEIATRQAQLKSEQEAGAKRMAELKAQLAAMRKPPKRRRSAENDELEYLFGVWDSELDDMDRIVGQLRAVTKDCEQLALKVVRDVAVLLGR